MASCTIPTTISSSMRVTPSPAEHLMMTSQTSNVLRNRTSAVGAAKADGHPTTNYWGTDGTYGYDGR
ncbi:hypothetical protein PtA15_3A340 [Puccinia triticina]|uniref:Uncharacterized protein n=1 Tax=Puccinia triticina TaxID=208348 RepID=A0ABY7CE45_9BASI|nr:uncharacterized protein PtA15_3A340 [Puccinia triticina]WAQ82974.1 hypothetical protein PtA15_3A340 [Puccinia triticina]